MEPNRIFESPAALICFIAGILLLALVALGTMMAGHPYFEIGILLFAVAVYLGIKVLTD